MLVEPREGDRGDCVRPPSLAYALVIGDIRAVVACASPAHVDAGDGAVTVGGTLAAAGRAGRAHQRNAAAGGSRPTGGNAIAGIGRPGQHASDSDPCIGWI